MDPRRDVWASDWFPRALGGFLARADALRLAVCVSGARHSRESDVWRRYLLTLHGPLAPISARDLVVTAAQDGDWDAVCLLQRRCKPTSQRRREKQRYTNLEDAVRAIEATSGSVVARSLWEAIRLQRCHPVALPSAVLYSAARRGALSEIAWLVDVVTAFDAQRAIECAARGGHARAVQWLVDHAAARAAGDEEDDEDEEEGHAHHQQEGKRTWQCQIRLDDPVLSDVGVIVWREEPRNVAYAYVEGRGLLPPHRELRWVHGYPLMDWAAAQGDLELLRRLAAHPVARTSLSTNSLQLAAAQGHLDVLQWLWRHDEQPAVSSLARVMAEAAKRGDMAILQWAFSSADGDVTTLGSLTGVFQAACASGHLEVVRWLFQHCLDERIRPRYLHMTAADAGHLEIVRYLHEEQDYSVMGAAVAEAVAHGHLEAAQWLYDRSAAKLSDQEKAMLVPMAVKSGRLAVVKWLVADLGLWSNHAIENAVWGAGDEVVGVLEFLWERDYAQLRNSLASVSFVRLLMRGKVDVAMWIMRHVEESDASPIAAADVVWFSSLVWRHGPDSARSTKRRNRKVDVPAELLTKNILDLALAFRPRFCCQIKRLPVWVALHCDVSTLGRLAAIGHQGLFEDATVDAIVHGTRAPAPMMWILQRRPLSRRQTKQVVRWAAQYCALSVLQLLLDSSKTDKAFSFVCLRIAAWYGDSYGHPEVLQLVQDRIQRSPGDTRPDLSAAWVKRDPAKSRRAIDTSRLGING